MPSSRLILCRPLFLLPTIPPSIRVFSNESTLLMRWPEYWSFSFSISPSRGGERAAGASTCCLRDRWYWGGTCHVTHIPQVGNSSHACTREQEGPGNVLSGWACMCQLKLCHCGGRSRDTVICCGGQSHPDHSHSPMGTRASGFPAVASAPGTEQVLGRCLCVRRIKNCT